MTTVGKFNPNSTIKEYVKGMREMPKSTREAMLDDIKKAMGSEQFMKWYDYIYPLRRDGKHIEYEQAIQHAYNFLFNSSAWIVDGVSSPEWWDEQKERPLS